MKNGQWIDGYEKILVKNFETLKLNDIAKNYFMFIIHNSHSYHNKTSINIKITKKVVFKRAKNSLD